MVYVASNLGGGQNGHLMLTMTSAEYTSQTGFKIVLPQNPVNYPPTMVTAQKQVLRTEEFQQNQAMFRKYNAVDGAVKNHIVTVV